MMKKMLALVLVLALAAGLLAMTATAATSDEVDYRVGYAKADINPYWSVWEATGGTIPTDLENYAVDQNGNPISSDHIMPLPMGGYGGNVHRLSRPELIDDNGSGVHADGVIYLTSNRYTEAFAKEMLGDGTDAYNAYKAKGFGQNDGDGIYATCVSIRQNADAEPVLMFSVDLISVGETYIGQAKNVIIRELKKQGISITPDRILINATHTHGAMSLGESFTASATYKQKLFGFDNSKSFDDQPTKYVPFLGSDLSDYLLTYRKHLYAQLAAAAVQALADGNSNGTVTMEKGTLDVSDVTGYQLNGVRHRKAQLTTTNADGDPETVDYVTGSSFNVDLDGETEISGVSESNDKLHVLQFSFPDASVDPILMVNWRAHTTANNKMGSKAHNNLSADFVAPMRTQLEQWGYRFILNYSTSGNLGMGDTPDTYDISTSATATTMNATKYGNMLALAAAYLADGTANSAVKTAYDANIATIQSKYDSAASSYETANTNYNTQQTNATNYQSQADSASISYLKNYYQGKADDAFAAAAEYKAEADKYAAQMQRWQITLDGVTPVMTSCTQGEVLLETTYYNVAYQSATDAQYQAALYHNALAVDEGGSASNDGGLKLEKTGYPFVVKAGTYTTEDGSSFTINEDVVIASQYHANSLRNRHGTLNAKRISLCAFTLGDQVAFVTVPFEASDRYSMSATLDTANNYNDWDNLVNDSKWGTPFVMSLTNGSEGYVPNNLAYTYTEDLEARTIARTIGQAFVSGSYEAHTAYSAAGEGENIVAALNTLLRNLDANGETAPATKTGYCEACKTNVTWTALNDKVVEDNGMSLTSGHYYLAEDYSTTFGAAMVYLDETVCLDLNGHTYYSNTNTGTSRVFNLYGTLNIQDSGDTGTMLGKMAGGSNGGTVLVNGLGTLNLYSGTLTCDTSGTGTVANGGVVYIGDHGVFNMYGGTVTGGKVSGYGGNISAQHSGDVGGTFNMYGGTVTGGSAGNTSYANLMVSGHSFFRYIGGSIPSGAFMQGTMYLGSPEGYPADTSETATVSIRNNGTVTLDGIFTGSVKLNYSNTKNEAYSTSPAEGDTLGAVVPGSWIDHVNGAKIAATSTSSYEGVVEGELLKLGTAPDPVRCDVCEQDVIWMPMVEGAVNGHFALSSNFTDMAEQTIPAYAKLCLNLNGNTYSASARAFTVNGTLNIQDTGANGTLQGTAVAGKNGGTILVNADGTLNQYSGTLTCDHVSKSVKITNGGVVYVAADGSYTMHDGTVTGGYATYGGNVQAAAGAEFILDGGTITAGNATTAGGNVYTYGIFTMNGGSISGGEADSYGGNVHAQGASAVFTMTGGTVTGGTGSSNICTGSNRTDNTSTFRMEGGSVTGTVYVQGKVVLTGTTNGTVNITSKVPSERLTIDGTYTGTINLTVSGVSSFAPGDKIGNATNDADISGATIKVSGAATTQHVEIVGNELRMGGKVVTGISVNTDAVKTTYKPGEPLDTTGLVVNRVYSDSSTQVIADGYTVTGYDPAVTGAQTVTVTYGDYTTTFDVYVKVLASIAVDTLPTKTQYTVGEELVIDGMTLTAIYDDGSEEPVTEGFTWTGFDSSTAGTKTVTVEYQGCTTTFEVTVASVTYLYYVNEVGFMDLDAAMEASTSQYPVVLNTDVTSMTLSKNLYLDLNGFDVTGVDTNGKKLYCLDSATNDYDVEDGKYGTVTAGANIQAATGYLAVTEGEATSFHKYEMEVTHVVLNPTDRSINYKSSFKGDQKVKEQIKEFGIAMRAYNAPNETSIWSDPDCETHTAHTQEEWVTGDVATAFKSVGVTNIIDPNIADNAVNKARSEILVYGRAYILLESGEMLFGEAYGFTLQSVTEYIDTLFNSEYLDDGDRQNLVEMYNTYSSFMQDWELTNIEAAAGVSNDASSSSGDITI